MTSLAKGIYATTFLIQHGLPEHGAIGVVSPLWRESKLEPGSQGVQPSETPGVLNPRGAFGIASWNGPRQGDLKLFCLAKSIPADTLESQLLFVLTECAGFAGGSNPQGYPRVWAAIRDNTLTYDQIIPIFVKEYENPKAPGPEIRDSIAYANELFAAYVIPPLSPTQSPAPVVVPSPPAPGASISASSAGRRAAVRDSIGAMRDSLLAERAAIDAEIAILDATAAEFGKLDPVPAIPAIEKPVVEAATTRTRPMTNTKPALASTGVWGGIIAAGVPILSQVFEMMGHSVDPKVQAAGAALGGLMALYGRITATSQISGIIKS